MRIIKIAFLFLTLLAGAARAQEAGSGWLGVNLKDLTKEEADALGWEARRGAKVVKAVPNGPAEAAGLKPDDILVSLDGMEIESVKAICESISKKAAGAEVKLAILRDKREKRLAVKLGVQPDERPFLRLDTGGHMAVIRTIAFTPDGRQLVSASDDKTIRVWDVVSGKTVRVLRGDVAPSDAGKVFAMALSPDGKWLAAGGWMKTPNQSDHHIRLYDFSSGRLVALLTGHGDIVNHLAFSSDSRYLISCSDDNTAIVWDVAARKAQTTLKGHRGHINGVGFMPDGKRAVTASYDHDLRVWSTEDGALLKILRGHRNRVFSVAITQNGLIVSGDDSGEIRLWDGLTGEFLRTIARLKTDISSLSISPDGKSVLAAGGDQGTDKEGHVYDIASGRQILTYKALDGAITATAISPDGFWAATGGGNNNEIHVWDTSSGLRRKSSDEAPLTLAGIGRSVFAVGFSANGREIGWGNIDPCPTQSDCPNSLGSLQFALTLPSANRVISEPIILGPEAKDKPWRRAITRRGTWLLAHRTGGPFHYNAILDIRTGDRIHASIKRNDTNGFDHAAYTFSEDGQIVISGGDGGVLSAYDRDGKKLGDFVGHESDVQALAPSPDGRYLLSGSDDQTVRLWNLQTRELLVTIFRGTDGEWVMWTPQGFYASSGPGAELIGWQVNHGPEHAAEYVTAAQLRRHLNRPDIVARAIQLASAEAAVKEAHGADFKLLELLTKPVPQLRILSPDADASLRGGYAEVKVELGATPDPVKLIRIQVNGRQIADKQPDAGHAGFTGKQTFRVPLAKDANKIAIAAVNDTGETVAKVTVVHEGEGALDKRGTLYILAIGVDKYSGLGLTCGDDRQQSCDLRYAGADAKAFADTMERDAGPLHERVVKRVLVNGAGDADAPTASNILDALGLLRDAKENDTAMLFVSGHGANEGPNYRFVPTDAAWSGGALRPATVVPWYAFQEALTSASGRRILFLDTCHSGNAFNQKLIGDSYQANIVVYSSARWDQFASEDETLGGGHGLFTYVLVEGVDGGARDKVGDVRAEGLRDFLRDRVRELAAKLNQDQEPQYFRARDADNYVLARSP